MTGASGTVGRHLMHAVRDRGWDGVAVGRSTHHAQGDSVTATDYSPASLERILAGADAVVHLAWRREPSDTLSSWYPNVDALEHLLAVAPAAGVQTVVYASSVSVYGGSATPWRESDALAPATAYGTSKVVGEHLVGRANGDDLRTVSLRLGHVYAPDEDNGYAVNRFIRLAEAGEPITVTGDCTSRRDMTYVDDVVTAILLALDTDGATGPVNVGSGAPVSMGELARAAAAAFGGRSVVHRHDEPGEGRPFTQMDLTRARDVLGYAPRYDLASAMTHIASTRRAA